MKHLLRIGMFVGAFPVASETFILRQITGLLDLGHDVRIFANVRGDDEVDHEALHRYQLKKRATFVNGPAESVFWEMPVTPLREQTWLPGAEESIPNVTRLKRALPALLRCLPAPALARSVLNAEEYGYRARSLSGIFRLRTLLDAGGRFDVLHAHFGPVGNCFRFTRKLFRAPLVVSFHGYDFSTVPRKEGRDVYKKLFATADVVTANSNYTKSQLENLGCDGKKIVNLPVGLNPDEFAFRARQPEKGAVIRLLTVARLVEIKGHEYVLRALARLPTLLGRIRYDIVGEGPLRQKLEALAVRLNLRHVVTFYGPRSEEEVRQLFAKAHVFLLCSVNVDGDQEGQGLVLQEAQACGLPVIATRHGAFPEGIAPENARWLVPERDVEALAAKLEALVAASGQWPTIGNSGRTFVDRRYDIRLLNLQLVEIYRTAMERFRL